MSMSVTRKLICSTGKLMRSNSKYGGIFTNGHRALGATTSKSMTRSLWYTCRADDSYTRKFPVQRTCQCRTMHTQGDKEMSDFLTSEISTEKKAEKKIADSVGGFQILSTKGADVAFQKKQENETIKISFNVNGTVDDAYMDEDNPDQDQVPEEKMLSKPPFVVDINKGGDATLSLHCNFPHPGDEIKINPEDDQHYEDLIEIQEVTLLKGEKWEESTYYVLGTTLDGNLYDMLLNMLEERGIDGPFIEQLVEYATAYEQKKYLGFLEGLKDFANSK